MEVSIKLPIPKHDFREFLIYEIINPNLVERHNVGRLPERIIVDKDTGLTDTLPPTNNGVWSLKAVYGQGDFPAPGNIRVGLYERGSDIYVGSNDYHFRLGTAWTFVYFGRGNQTRFQARCHRITLPEGVSSNDNEKIKSFLAHIEDAFVQMMVAIADEYRDRPEITKKIYKALNLNAPEISDVNQVKPLAIPEEKKEIYKTIKKALEYGIKHTTMADWEKMLPYLRDGIISRSQLSELTDISANTIKNHLTGMKEGKDGYPVYWEVMVEPFIDNPRQ